MSLHVIPMIQDRWNRHIEAFEPELKTIPTGDGKAVWLECVGVHPKSSAGKEVFVQFDEQAVTLMIKALRRAAIVARSQPINATDRNQ